MSNKRKRDKTTANERYAERMYGHRRTHNTVPWEIWRNRYWDHGQVAQVEREIAREMRRFPENSILWQAHNPVK